MKRLRYIAIAFVLLCGVAWAFASSSRDGDQLDYPNSGILARAQWLHRHLQDEDLVIVDVRTDDHFDGKLIPGAIRMPWSLFRENDLVANTAERFVGVSRSEKVLGSHGIGRTSRIVLYDSVERDGGATAAYVFWVLDLLGHTRKMVLERGIDAWEEAGYDLDSRPKTLSPILYQAPLEEINLQSLVDGDFIYKRLGDRHYQIIDVRSPEEYEGRKKSRGLRGEDLKTGHIPTAVNIDYRSNWADAAAKRLKPYRELRELYRGLDPDRGIVVYCDSGRRSSFSYFVLRLMGIDDVRTYEASWQEWGQPGKYFPVEIEVHEFSARGLPAESRRVTAQPSAEKRSPDEPQGASSGQRTEGGYVSCGG